MILLLILLGFLTGSLRGNNDCGVPRPELAMVLSYEAWSDHWLATSYRKVPQSFRIYRDARNTLFYLIARRKIFAISDGRVVSATCNQNQEWSVCMGGWRSFGQSLTLTDLLLGKTGSHPPISPDQVCMLALDKSRTIPNWSPSSASDFKDRMLDAVALEAIKAANYFGSVKQVTCANFNTSDPQIWLIVEITDNTGATYDMVVGVNIDSQYPLKVTAANIRETSENDAALVTKILSDSLAVPIVPRRR